MARMLLHQHKYALSITVLLLAVIGGLLGAQLHEAGNGILDIMAFSFLLLGLAMIFILTSLVLRTREELHELHGELHKTLKLTHSEQKTKSKRKTTKK